MTRYVKNDQTVDIYTLRDMYPNASIPDGGDASMFGWEFLIETPAPEQEYGYTISEGIPVNNTQTWVKEKLPENVVAQQARNTRDELLKASDWTQVADAPVDKAAWTVYRQALRDITSQAGFPYTITWPVAP